MRVCDCDATLCVCRFNAFDECCELSPPPPPLIVAVVCSVESNGRAFGAVDGFFDAVVAVLRTHRDNADVMGAACASICNVCNGGEASRVSVCVTAICMQDARCSLSLL